MFLIKQHNELDVEFGYKLLKTRFNKSIPPATGTSSLIPGAGQCGANEIQVSCQNACQPYCGLPERAACPSFACTVGCHCSPGYIRLTSSENSACVPLSQCSTVGGTQACSDPNKIYQTCGSACPIGCDNIANPPAICSADCVRGCFCRCPNGNPICTHNKHSDRDSLLPLSTFYPSTPID